VTLAKVTATPELVIADKSWHYADQRSGDKISSASVVT
jgi:hypothetical protein